MKKKNAIITSVIIVLTLITGYSMANGMNRGPGMFSMRGPGMEYIFDELNVTDEQKTALEAVMTEFRDEMRSSDRTERPTEEERAAHQALLQQRLSTVLTANQLDGIEKYMAAHSMDRGGKGGRMHRGSKNCERKGPTQGSYGNN